MRFFYLFLFAVFVGACCSGAYEVAVFRVVYPELNQDRQLYIKKYTQHNIQNVADTILVGDLKESNEYTQLIEIEEGIEAYVFFIPETNYKDSVYNIEVIRKKCDKNIKETTYTINGKLKEGTRIIIK